MALGMLIGITWVGLLSQGTNGQVIGSDDSVLQNIDIDEKLGEAVPHNISLVNDAGKKVPLGQYFDGETPVILIVAYYTCPMLCDFVLNGVGPVITELAWTPGRYILPR